MQVESAPHCCDPCTCAFIYNSLQLHNPRMCMLIIPQIASLTPLIMQVRVLISRGCIQLRNAGDVSNVTIC